MAYQNFRSNNYGGNNQGRGFNRGGYGSQPTAEPIKALPLPSDYLDAAEELMRTSGSSITTSKIRRLYSSVTEIYNNEKLRTEDELSPDSIAAVGMTRIRFAYECGRDPKVKNFVESAKLLEYLKGIGKNRKSFIRFTRYMEALVAYHKFFGGREN